MKKQFDNTKQCRSCGVTLHGDSYHNHKKSDKFLLIKGEQNLRPVKDITNGFAEHLKLGKHKKKNNDTKSKINVLFVTKCFKKTKRKS